jgi:hypothetical protein
LFNSKQFFFSQLQGLVHAAIIFYTVFLSSANSGILNSESGYSTDLWTSSVATFTALVATVNFNLLLRMKFVTMYHMLSFLVVSITCYIGFMWFTNFFDFGWTQFSVLEAHLSPIFYLSIFFTTGFCFLLDYLYECYWVLIKTSPVSFLRRVISQNLSIQS